jgi:aspartate kinase
MEQAIVSAVTHDKTEAKVTVTGVPDEPGIAARLFRSLADRQVNLDMIVQNVSTRGHTDISFTVPKLDAAAALEVCQSHADEIGAAEVMADSGISKVSLIGAGMKSHPGIAATMFEVLAKDGINIEMISTSPIRISCVVRAERAEDAVQSLHAAFELEAP